MGTKGDRSSESGGPRGFGLEYRGMSAAGRSWRPKAALGSGTTPATPTLQVPMTDSHPTPDDETNTVREQVRLLLREFGRFGVDGSAPEVLAASPATTDEIARSRQRLVDVLQNDERLNHLDTIGRSDLEGLRMQLVRLAVEGRLQNFLSEVDVPYPIYNFFAGFDNNFDGPWDRTPPVEYAPLTDVRWRLMGLPVRFPIGVPASGLTANARWIRYFAHQGFNILTYKTVRSREYKAYRWPQWVFIEDVDPWSSIEEARSQKVSGDLTVWPKELADFSTANSFGMPSPDPKVWQSDVDESLKALEPGQLLIVSVVGSWEEFEGVDLVNDFVTVARLAEQAGAPAVELNLSCPNTISHRREEGMRQIICTNPKDAGEITRSVRGALNSGTKLVAKLGALEHEVLAAVIDEIGDAVDAISGINTVQVPVFSPITGDTPFIGTFADPTWPRREAGVSGRAIRQLGLDFVSDVISLRQGRRFDVIAMGGVMSAHHVDEYMCAGAAAVQTATGANLHPDIPKQVAEYFDLTDGSEARWRPPQTEDTGTRHSLLQKVADLLATGGYSLLSGRKDGG